MMDRPFHPGNPSTTISVTGSPTATALTGGGAPTRQTVELQNAGSLWVFVDFGTSSGVTTAVATGYPVGPGQSKLVTIPAGYTHIAAIGSAAGPTTLYVTVGMGI